VTAAESHFRRAAEADRDRTEAHCELAALHLASGALEEARAAALGALRRNAEDEAAHRLLYDAQVRSEDYRNAEITLHSLEKLAPADGGVQLALAWFYAASPDARWRNGPWARYHARAAERLLGSDGDDVLMAMALAEAAAGNSEAAAAAAERGASLARERGEPDVRNDFENLLSHLRQNRVIESRPRLFAVAPR